MAELGQSSNRAFGPPTIMTGPHQPRHATTDSYVRRWGQSMDENKDRTTTTVMVNLALSVCTFLRPPPFP